MSGGIERIGWAVRLEDGSWSDSKGWNVPWPQMMDQETAEFVARSWREDADEEDRDDAQAILFYTAPEGTIESLEAENRELRGVVEKYGDDPDYARSRFRQIDLMVDQRGHDRLKIDGLEKRVASLVGERDALRSKLEHATNVRGALEAERDQLKAREEHFASVLGVADGGQYRNDWDARITAVLAERDELRATVERYRALLAELHAVVTGECPSLFNEDSGGDANLDLDIRELLNPGESHEQD